MTKHSEEYVSGWQAARAQYQSTGGVQPYPPGFGKDPEPEPKSAPPRKGPPRKTKIGD